MKLDKNDVVAVTGGEGFVGKFVCEELKKNGFENIFVVKHKDFDLTKEKDVKTFYETVKPSSVIHLAAEVGGIGANMEAPGRFFYANAMMGMLLIEYARINNIKKFVQIGTVCSYPKIVDIPFKEEDIWQGFPEETNSPYGISKKSLLVMLQAYRDQYDLNGIYLIPTNLYGVGDDFDYKTSHVIPALIRKTLKAKERGESSVECWGTGSASREFLYVEDCARAIVQAFMQYNRKEPVNIGSGKEINIKDLVNLIIRLCDYNGDVCWDTTKPDGQPRRCIDTSKALKCFDFEAQVGFEDGLKKTINWWMQQEKNE